jgi:hypothetical protein
MILKDLVFANCCAAEVIAKWELEEIAAIRSHQRDDRLG